MKKLILTVSNIHRIRRYVNQLNSNLSMKIILLLFCVTFLSVGGSSQDFVRTGRLAQDLVPKGWGYEKIPGDLNKDKYADLVLIATPSYDEGIVVTDNGVYNFNAPVVAVYLGREDGVYTLFKQYNNILAHTDNDTCLVETSVTINEKRVLRFGFSLSCSSSEEFSRSAGYLFRWESGDLFLIGEGSDVKSNVTGKGTKSTINYNTHKKELILYDNQGEVCDPQWYDLPKEPKKPLGSFKMFER